MATGGGEVNSDEIKNIKCCFCSKKNRNREAVKYCVECKEYYCSSCTETHQMFPSMTGHVVLDKSEFRSVGSDGDLLSVPTQRCSQHQSEVTNMYCKDHDEVVCPPCIALNHRSCTNILFIPEEVDNLYNETEVKKVKQKILQIKTTMQDIKSAKEYKVKELKEVFDKEVQSVKAIRLELQALLDKQEQKTLEELEREFNTMESSLTSQINEVDSITETIDMLWVQMKKAEGNKAQEFVSVKFSEKITSKAINLEKEHHSETGETVSFVADQNIKAFLQQLQTLGKVARIKQGTINFKNCLYKVKHKREIDAKLSREVYNCSIRCSCITPDGSLLLADNNENNKLKRLDMSTETINDSINFQDRPCAVCLISKTEVAVTLEDNTIQFVSLENKLSATRKLTMNHHCYGLAHKDGKLFISDEAKTLYIHDMNGQELKRISTDANGKKLFHTAAHITFSAEGDRLFVANGNKGIVILDIQGNYLSTLSHSTLSRTWGVCTDGANLFVCGRNSHNIVQIGQDNKVLGHLEKVNEPYSLSFDPRNKRLFVTLCCKNKITVLDLE